MVRILGSLDRARGSLRREQGQDVLEYAGMLVLVAAIIVALLQLGLPAHISDAINSTVNSVLGGGGNHAGATVTTRATH